MRILVFGDSIVQGFWDSGGGWVRRLAKKYDMQRISGESEDPPSVFNLGISGDFSDSVLSRFEDELSVRILDEVILVFAVGLNDSAIISGQNYSDLAIYEKNLAQLLTKAHKYTYKVLFVGLTPCLEKLTSPVSWDNVVYINERIVQFDSTLSVFCDKNQVEFVEVFKPFEEALKTEELLLDGLHPKDRGHELIASLVIPAVEGLINEIN